MSIMQCNRNGCEAILCDLHSSYHGYICYDCMAELKSRVPDVSVEVFMKSKKNCNDLSRQLMKEAVISYIDQEFTPLS